MVKFILLAAKIYLILFSLGGFIALINNLNLKGFIYGGGQLILGVSGYFALDARFGKKSENEKENI